MKLPPTRICRSPLALAAIGIVLAGGGLVSAYGADRVTVDEIAKVWQAREKAAQTLRIEWEADYHVAPGAFEGEPKVATIYHTSFTFIADANRLRFESRHITPNVEHEIVPQEEHWVWGDDEFRKLSKPGAIRYLRGRVAKLTTLWESPADHMDANLEPILMNYRPFHPASSRFAKFHERFYVVPGAHKAEGIDCILLAVDIPQRVTLLYYLDADRDFSVIKRSDRQANGREIDDVTFHDYARHDGLWVPTRWTIHSPRITVAARMSRFTFNETVDGSEFVIDFPFGTWLIDAAMMHFVVKEGGRRRPVTNADRGSGKMYEDFVKTEPAPPPRDRNPADDAAMRVKELAGIRLRQANALKGREMLSALVFKDRDVEVRIEPVGPMNLQQPAEVAIDDSSGNAMLFGKARDEAAARDALAERVRRQIESVGDICALTGEQKTKLRLAGSVDNADLLKRAEKMRPLIKRVFDEESIKRGELDPVIMKVCEEMRPLRQAVESDSIEPSSRFAKTLKGMLSPEQAAKYEAARARPASAESGPRP